VLTGHGLSLFLTSAQAANRGARGKRNSADLATIGESVVRVPQKRTGRQSRHQMKEELPGFSHDWRVRCARVPQKLESIYLAEGCRMSRCIRNLMICIILAANSLHGVYMRHDQVQELMDAMNAPKSRTCSPGRAR
jgi:hypothetical protein